MSRDSGTATDTLGLQERSQCDCSDTPQSKKKTFFYTIRQMANDKLSQQNIYNFDLLTGWCSCKRRGFQGPDTVDDSMHVWKVCDGSVSPGLRCSRASDGHKRRHSVTLGSVQGSSGINKTPDVQRRRPPEARLLRLHASPSGLLIGQRQLREDSVREEQDRARTA